MSSLTEFYTKYPIKQLVINHKKWEYITCGKGKRTLLILPGGGQSAQSNFRLIQSFENEHKVIAITIHGANSISEVINAINKILDAEGVKKVILYGLSLGGMMALVYSKRNTKTVSSLILSHCCTPDSPVYKNNVLKPLFILDKFLSIIPYSFIAFFAKNFGGRIQGSSKGISIKDNDKKSLKLTKEFAMEFKEKYFNKRLLRTWINLHKEYSRQRLSQNDFKSWDEKVLIMQSDNDPLVKDDGGLENLFPSAIVYTFSNTGHTTYYSEFPTMESVMHSFLNN